MQKLSEGAREVRCYPAKPVAAYLLGQLGARLHGEHIATFLWKRTGVEA